ncbi:MAG: RNA methyltransferase [Chitinophagales bacterium]|nr:RNA methyltransferase [Chitinophagales bacterium]
MLSKAKIKFVRSLQLKKFRQKYRYYTAEGPKIINELLKNNSQIHTIFALENSAESLMHTPENCELIILNSKELKLISNLSTPQGVLAVVAMEDETRSDIPENGLILALDSISDPGNMGTIIRSADWFGVDAIICSENCVDIYNPKVVQAAMGSVGRIPVFVRDIKEYISNSGLPSFAAVLDGDNIEDVGTSPTSIIVIGNESRGIDPDIIEVCDHTIRIEKYGKAESLNAAVATSVLLFAIRSVG